MTTYQEWLESVRSTLHSINMPMDEWQLSWHFDFESEYKAGSEVGRTAEKANRYWWRKQNEALYQECKKDDRCWLPRNHSGECQPQ